MTTADNSAEAHIPEGFATWREAATAERVRRANAEMAAEYYRACLEQRAPKRVTLRVRLAGTVRGDGPVGHNIIAREGECEFQCESNRCGAAGVVAENGRRLGLKPSELEAAAWRESSRARAPTLHHSRAFLRANGAMLLKSMAYDL